jgi:hypothetical protein
MSLDDLATPLDTWDARRLAIRIAKDEDTAVGMLAAAHEMGVAVARNLALGRRTCRICGCWELAACEGGCCWIADDLCSACSLSSDMGEGALGRINPLLCEEL